MYIDVRDMVSQPTIHIVIAEDVTLIRRLLVQYLARESRLKVVAEAANGLELVQACKRFVVDVALVDIGMPQMSGLEAAAILRKERSDVSLVFLTGYEDLLNVGYTYGADACLSKSSTPSEVVRTVVSAHEMREFRLRRTGAALTVNTSLLAARFALNAREEHVLSQIVNSNLSNQEICQALYQNTEARSLSRIKHYVSQLMSKLKIEPRNRQALMK